MELIVISNPVSVPDEHRLVNAMFEAGLQRFHLRKPNAAGSEIAKYLKAIDARFLQRVVLHSHHRLVLKYHLGGIHLNEATRLHPSRSEKLLIGYLRMTQQQLSISTSFHEVFDLKNATENFSYGFLSPVFESISKPGYQSNFDLKILKEILSKTKFKVFALGGINSERLPVVKQLGFKGAAMIGAIWNDSSPLEACKQLLNQCQPVSHIA